MPIELVTTSGIFAVALPDQTIIHTGHGDSTPSGAERAGVAARAGELGL